MAIEIVPVVEHAQLHGLGASHISRPSSGWRVWISAQEAEDAVEHADVAGWRRSPWRGWPPMRHGADQDSPRRRAGQRQAERARSAASRGRADQTTAPSPDLGRDGRSRFSSPPGRAAARGSRPPRVGLAPAGTSRVAAAAYGLRRGRDRPVAQPKVVAVLGAGGGRNGRQHKPPTARSRRRGASPRSPLPRPPGELNVAAGVDMDRPRVFC
jgi:hypothetical protein